MGNQGTVLRGADVQLKYKKYSDGFNTWIHEPVVCDGEGHRACGK